MDLLPYLTRYNTYQDRRPDEFRHTIRIRLITNFTDGIIRKILIGMALAEGVYPVIESVPYKQYHIYLKVNPALEPDPDITFIFFDINPYTYSEFRAQPGHHLEVVQDLAAYCQNAKGIVVITTAPTPYRSAYGSLYRENPLFRLVQEYDTGLRRIVEKYPNTHILDVNSIVHELGEHNAREFRNLYAFDLPFSDQFSLALCEEWFSYVRTKLGKVKKCIVVDLDNTLWGGIVGDVGPLGIELGPTYPGNAFQNFQRALADFSQRGIILGVNSRNNQADVMEVFEKNPHMVVKEKDFATLKVNWNTKTENLVAIAQELNIGLDSIVYFDDDPLNRELVRRQLPDVLVPEFSLPPEQYVRAVYALRVFDQASLTEEDKGRNRMYAQERERRTLRASAGDVSQYLAELGIEVQVQYNHREQTPRIAQLTQKTNQFNVTTRRYTESDIAACMEKGLVAAGSVRDRFGEYGTVLVGIARFPTAVEADLDTFLMSCRVMGRGVEYAFLDALIRQLVAKGFSMLRATFIPSPKNDPARSLLPEMGFRADESAPAGVATYRLDLGAYKTPARVNAGISIT